MIVEFEVDEEFGVRDREGTEAADGGRRLERQPDVEGDEMVGALLHPVFRDFAEGDSLAVELEGGEVTHIGEPARVFPCEGGEDVAGGELAGLGQSLRGEGRIHLVEHPVLHHGRDLAVGGEGDAAVDGDPDMRMRMSRPDHRQRHHGRSERCARKCFQRFRSVPHGPALPRKSGAMWAELTPS